MVRRRCTSHLLESPPAGAPAGHYCFDTATILRIVFDRLYVLRNQLVVRFQ